jgi:hypothetical protein
VFKRACRPRAGAPAADRYHVGNVIVDQSKAYRCVGVDDDAFWRCVPYLSEDGVLKAVRFRRLMFGETSSPLGYNAVARCFSIAVARVLIVPASHYYDDYASPCRLPDHKLLPDLEEFFGILGILFSKKSQIGDRTIYLGLQQRDNWSETHLSLSHPRRQRIRLIMQRAVNANQLLPSPAGKLKGKLIWGNSSTFGRFGMAMMNPIANRARRVGGGPAWLNASLRESLLWWLDILDMEGVFDRVVRVDGAKKRGTVYSDASEHGLGFVLFLPDCVIFASVSVQGEDYQDIAVWEAAAILLVYRCVWMRLQQCLLLFLVDNNGVLSGVTKGWSRSDIINVMVGASWKVCAVEAVAPWYERVPSASNLSDAPSRLFDPALGAAENREQWLRSVRSVIDGELPLFECRVSWRPGGPGGLLGRLVSGDVITALQRCEWPAAEE